MSLKPSNYFAVLTLGSCVICLYIESACVLLAHTVCQLNGFCSLMWLLWSIILL